MKPRWRRSLCSHCHTHTSLSPSPPSLPAATFHFQLPIKPDSPLAIFMPWLIPKSYLVASRDTTPLVTWTALTSMLTLPRSRPCPNAPPTSMNNAVQRGKSTNTASFSHPSLATPEHPDGLESEVTVMVPRFFFGGRRQRVPCVPPRAAGWQLPLIPTPERHVGGWANATLVVLIHVTIHLMIQTFIKIPLQPPPRSCHFCTPNSAGCFMHRPVADSPFVSDLARRSCILIEY